MCPLQEKYEYIVSGPEKSTLDPMDQTPLTRFIKVFDLKDEAIVFQGRSCLVRAWHYTKGMRKFHINHGALLVHVVQPFSGKTDRHH